MKKLLFIIAMILPMAVCAADFVVNGVAYKVLSMNDLTCEVTLGCLPDNGKLVIPATVEYKGRTFTVLGIGSRENESSLLPSSICELGSLTDLTIMNGPTYIDESAFRQQKISKVRIPKSITRIGVNAFWKNNKYYIDSGLTSQTDPTEVILDDGDEDLSLEQRLFYGPTFNESKVTRLYLGRNLGSNNDAYIFNGADLEELIIGDKVTRIPNGSFTSYQEEIGDFSSLKKLVIGKGMDEVPYLDEGDNIKKVYVRTMTPQKSLGFRDGTFVSATLYVPKGSMDAYSRADVWKNFWTIEEYEGYDENIYYVAWDLNSFFTMSWDESEEVYKSIITDVAMREFEKYRFFICTNVDFLPLKYTWGELEIPNDNSTVIIRYDPKTQDMSATVQTAEVLKCAKPVINYVDGKISFTCDTEGAVCHWSITSQSSGTGLEVSNNLTATIKVYATKENYANSDTATMNIVISGGLKGDVDGNGVVNVADHVELSKIILGQ
jgi:hypothetical protein